MKLAFAVFVAAASAVEWPNVDINYTYPQPLGMYPGDEKKQTTCAEAEAALMASENNSMHKTHLSLPYFKECADKCMEFQNMEITGGMGNQRCWSKMKLQLLSPPALSPAGVTMKSMKVTHGDLTEQKNIH